MLDMFWAQWLVETEDIPRPEDMAESHAGAGSSTGAQGPGSKEEEADAVVDKSGGV